jgi:hypothetical protein
MKTRKRQLAHPGIFGTMNNPVAVTDQDLREIAETFTETKKAQVTLGHSDDPKAPRLGYVASVSYDEHKKILAGEVVEADTLSKAVDDGFFPDCSIGAKRRAADGKMYLHHLAYLGEQPPAIKDLEMEAARVFKENEFAAVDGNNGTIIFPAPNSKQLRLSDTPNPVTPAGTPGERNTKENPMDELEQAKADLKVAHDKIAAQDAELAKFKERLAALAEKYPDESIELADSDPRVADLMKQLRGTKQEALLKAARGKLPKAKQGLVSAFADALSVGSSIELADGDQKRQVSPLDLAAEIFAEIPSMVKTGALDLADDGKEKPAIDLAGIMGHV